MWGGRGDINFILLGMILNDVKLVESGLVPAYRRLGKDSAYYAYESPCQLEVLGVVFEFQYMTTVKQTYVTD